MRNVTIPSLQCLDYYNYPQLQVGVTINCHTSAFYCIFSRVVLDMYLRYPFNPISMHLQSRSEYMY